VVEQKRTLTIRDILAYSQNDRSVRAYVFLYTQFLHSEHTTSPVRDAVDCLSPFIVPFLAQIPGKQVDISSLQSFLRSTFGFDIPLYALDMIIPTLQARDLVKYIKSPGIYISNAKNIKDYDLNREGH
jgi:hypothetical protein